MFHRLHERIEAHAALCFMAPIVYRGVRQRLKLGDSPLSPQAALAALRRIQNHRIATNASTSGTGVSTIHHEQEADLCAALQIAKSVQDAQMSLL